MEKADVLMVSDRYNGLLTSGANLKRVKGRKADGVG